MRQNPRVIDRRTQLAHHEFVQEYLYPNRPVIVRGALCRWKALGKWTPEFFRGTFGGKTFTIPDGEYGQDDSVRRSGTTLTLAELIDRVLESTPEKPAPYLRNVVLREHFAPLLKDIEPLPEYLFPNWLGERYLVPRVGSVLNRGAEVELYIGGTGGRFPVLHYDGAGTHAFLMQIYGRKEYIVYAPDQEPFLYPSPRKPNLSLIDSIDRPDPERFPLFSKAEQVRCFLDPGELLFVPSHWWHTARILSPSITVSANVLNESNWRELMQYIALRQGGGAKGMAAQVYLKIAGARRSWRDRMAPGRAPGA